MRVLIKKGENSVLSKYRNMMKKHSLGLHIWAMIDSDGNLTLELLNGPLRGKNYRKIL